MAHTIREIAEALGAEAVGDVDLPISGAAEPQAAGPDQIALAMDPRYADRVAQGRARVALLWPGADWKAMGLHAAIFVPRGRMAMAMLTRILEPEPHIPAGIHPTAVIAPSALIGKGAAIGPFVVIGPDARIGENARILSHVSIGEKAVIGDDALLFQGVHIGARAVIGNRFIAQANAVVGSDGFSFVTPEKSGIEEVRETLGPRAHIHKDQKWTRIHSLGAVTIGDDVLLGTGSAIDRGTIRDTIIGRGTKIDNLVQIGHNVRVGEDCMLCSMVGIAGSSQIGDRVVLAGQVGVNDNIFIGDDVIAGGATKIFTNVPAGRVILGYPAVRMETHIEMQKALRRLPRLMRRIAELERMISGAHSDADDG